MNLRLGLRWKILLLTAAPLAALAAASLWFVDRGVSTRTEQALRDDLRRASDVFETMLAADAHELVIAGSVIVRDPRFFAMLSVPHGANDSEFRSTVGGVAQDFRRLTHPEVFEVVDSRGDVAASVGDVALQSSTRAPLVASALAGRVASLAVPQGDTHLMLVATPVLAGGRVIGVLVMGRGVGRALAERLRDLTKSEVTFLVGGRITATTLIRPEDVEAARTVGEGRSGPATPARVVAGADGPWLALSRPLPLAEEGAQQTYVLQRSIEAETAFLRSVRGHLVELGLLMLAAVTLAAMFISTHLTRPITQLVRAAEAMEAGRWDAPITRDRADEIGYLAARFDDMRQRQRTYVESLEEVSRAKSEFIAIASHELRTPISIIRGWENLLRGGHADEKNGGFAKALEAIDRACETLERIAEDATRMANASEDGVPFSPASTEIEPLIAEAVRDAVAAAPERHVKLEVDIAPAAHHATVDRTQMIQAIDALVRNGIRFTPDGGRVRVAASSRGEALVLAVSDTGIGLSVEGRRRLFDEAYVPRESKNHHTAHGLDFNVAGLGFGLALVQRVVATHGGHLHVDGEEGRGSTFTLVLPGALAVNLEREAA